MWRKSSFKKQRTLSKLAHTYFIILIFWGQVIRVHLCYNVVPTCLAGPRFSLKNKPVWNLAPSSIPLPFPLLPPSFLPLLFFFFFFSCLFFWFFLPEQLLRPSICLCCLGLGEEGKVFERGQMPPSPPKNFP
jgi:hypothetical protein